MPTTRAPTPCGGRSRRRCAGWLSGYPDLVAQAVTTTGAEKVRWNLSDLFSGPDDSAIEASLARELERAKAFETEYRGRAATLETNALAVRKSDLAGHKVTAAKPEVYAYMPHKQNPQ